MRIALGSAAFWGCSPWCGTPALALSWNDFHPGAWNGDLQAAAEIDRRRTHGGEGTDIDYSLRRLTELFTIGNTGMYYLDPRLATFDAQVTLGRIQDREDANGSSRSSRAKLDGYSFSSWLFPGDPYTGTLFANRTQSFLTAPFGQTQLMLENRGAAFHLQESSVLRKFGFPYLSANIAVQQQHLLETTQNVLSPTLTRDEVRNGLVFDGHDGRETSDMDWRYEFADVDERDNRQQSFRSQAASLNYSRDFGATLNRRWDSRASLYRRTGGSQYGIDTLNEQLAIEHDSSFASTYRYALTHATAPSGATTIQNAGAQVRKDIFQNLSLVSGASLVRDTLPTGTRQIVEGNLDFRYRHDLPAKGTFSARAGGREQINDNRLSSSRTFVTDEAQAAPSPLAPGAGFLLQQPLVVPGSIVVVDTRGGARLPTTEGIDYAVVQEGDRARIVPLVTSAVIQPGDPLAISYAYDTPASLRYSTRSASASATVDFGWISATASHEQANQSLLSGIDTGFLQDLRKEDAHVDVHGRWAHFQQLGSAGYTRYDSTRLSYRQSRYSELFTYRPWASVSLGLSGDLTHTDYELPSRRTDARTLRATFDWYAGGWTTTATLDQRVFKDSTQPTETVTEATVKSRFDYGKLSIVGSLMAGDRDRGGFRTRNWGAILRFIRRL